MTHLVCVLALLFTTATFAAADTGKTNALNELRASAGLAAVRYSTELELAASRHAADMLTARFFSHTGSDGSSVGQRVARTGYRWCYVAENIAQGQPDLRQVMKAWTESPGHRANMLSRDVTEFALVQGGGYIWVMVLARPGC